MTHTHTRKTKSSSSGPNFRFFFFGESSTTKGSSTKCWSSPPRITRHCLKCLPAALSPCQGPLQFCNSWMVAVRTLASSQSRSEWSEQTAPTLSIKVVNCQKMPKECKGWGRPLHCSATLPWKVAVQQSSSSSQNATGIQNLDGPWANLQPLKNQDRPRGHTHSQKITD